MTLAVTSAKESFMSSDGCKHLQEFLNVELGIIQKHVDAHKWLNHLPTENEGVKDFIQKYGWLMRELYCSCGCPDRDNCPCKSFGTALSHDK